MPMNPASLTVRRLAACAFSALAWQALPATAVELKVLSAGAMQPPVSVLLDARRAKTGDKIDVVFTPIGGIMKRLDDGERFDLLIVPAEAADALAKQNRIVASTRVALGETGIGVAVRKGAPQPDISTPEAFKQALLNAKSIVMVDPERGTSGRYLAGVFKDLGIADAIAGKTRKVDGGYVVEAVAHGEVELGVHQITEILPVPGVTLVGPLPAPLQKITTYVAVVLPQAAEPAAAAALARELVSSESRAVYKAKGFAEPK
jgi:molybdate transport system substrate-binding protein